MSIKDPLGTYRKVKDKATEHKEKPISKEQYDLWLQDPVTQRMREELALVVEMYRSHALTPSTEPTALTDFQKGEHSGLIAAISWSPQNMGGVSDE